MKCVYCNNKKEIDFVVSSKLEDIKFEERFIQKISTSKKIMVCPNCSMKVENNSGVYQQLLFDKSIGK